VRIALVSPYSWTYPGGVARHVEALALALLEAGHDVRVLAPWDPDDRTSLRLHRGARPQERERPPWLVPLGRTLGVPMNGAVSNLMHSAEGMTRLRAELRSDRYDVVHVHEPIAPCAGWDALGVARAPLVGTFHAYATNPVPHAVGNLLGAWRRFNRLRVRIAVSEAAAWTAQRFFGGEYRVIPNGVALPPGGVAPHAPPVPGAPLRIVFVGQAVERKGLPVLLRAFEALREHVPAELTLVGASREEIAPLLLDGRGVRALGKVPDAAKEAALREADVAVAPSLGGESFGMVLTEAFAAGTPVVASDLPGYADVVRDGVDGVLVPRGDATALAAALRDLALDPARRGALASAAARSAERYAWPRVAAEVAGAYEDALALPAPRTAARRAAEHAGLAPAGGGPPSLPRRLPSLEPPPSPARAPARLLALVRRGALALAALLALALAVVALDRIGVDAVARSLVSSSPTWVVGGLGVMCASMVLRALAWHAILRAALPGVEVRRADALQGTFIGVLMSATLPARLGEPSRALIVARRLGPARELLPVVLGTIVSQTLLNALALVLLGVVMVSTVDVFTEHTALVVAASAPLVAVLLVLGAPAVARRDGRVRRALGQVRAGLRVFRAPRLGAQATVAQLAAWGLQWLSCFLLLVALGLDAVAGAGAAAAVLFAVNVTAVLPATPSNLGVFQAACVAVLGAYGVGAADALAYGIVLQSVEIATAVVMGAPALVKEGLSWREVRLRALHATPVELPPLPAGRRTVSSQT